MSGDGVLFLFLFVHVLCVLFLCAFLLLVCCVFVCISFSCVNLLLTRLFFPFFLWSLECGLPFVTFIDHKW